MNASFFENPLENPLFLILMVWALVWKGFALWAAAHNHHKKWFVVMLVLNTFGILEIIYLFYFNKPKAPLEDGQEDSQKTIGG